MHAKILNARHSSTVLAHVRSHLRDRDERGDVPGWVLITVMSVGIVAALSTLATDELSRILEVSLASVTR